MDDTRRGDATDASRGFTIVRLPDPQFDDDWAHIFVPDETKQRLLRYADRLFQARSHGSSTTQLGLRGMLLLSGPPGTGKSSLGRGLANVWASQHAEPAALVVLNAHTLPSGERGGSQRNIVSLFQQLDEVAAVGHHLFILCDEIESLATDRTSVNPGTNPLDSLYAVNALIEQLDQFVRRHANALFVLTSNLPRFIDRAIGDRVDLEVIIPLPDAERRRLILADTLQAASAQFSLPHLRQLLPHERIGGAPQTPYDVGTRTGLRRLIATARDTLNGTRGSRDGDPTNTWEPLHEPAIDELIQLTDGFSARLLRKLVAIALLASDDPSTLTLTDLITQAQQLIQQQRHHEETGGIYGYRYQRWHDRGTDGPDR